MSCHNCSFLRWHQVIKRSLHQIRLNDIHISLFIRQISLYDCRHLCKSCKFCCIGSVMSGKHFISLTQFSYDDRIQNSMFLNALNHILQSLTLIQMKWMVMKCLDIINLNLLHTILSLNLSNLRRSILSQQIHRIKYFSLTSISLHKHSTPLPNSHMPHMPYTLEHIPEAAHYNKQTLQPLLYLGSYCQRF